jgi:hypothetical protein
MPDDAIILNARAAIARHMQWKMTLQLAITMQEPLAAAHMEQIRHYRRCAIGRWLDSPVTQPMRLHAEYRNLVEKHISFHREMERIACLINDQRFMEAARAIDAHSSFTRGSQALALAIMAYDAVAAIAAPV